MLDRIDKLLFYFSVECMLCHNHLNVSHVVIQEQKGEIICSLCGKNIKIPAYEGFAKSAKDLADYLGDKLNAKYVKLVMNPAFKMESDVPAAAH